MSCFPSLHGFAWPAPVRCGLLSGVGDSRLEPLVPSETERQALNNWAKRRRTAQGLALRARIVLACAEGGPNMAVAARLGVNRGTVAKWRTRFLRHRLDGLSDDPRPGAPADHHRRPGGRSRGPHPRRSTRGRDALVAAGARRSHGDLTRERAADLARLRSPAVADGDLQDLPGSATGRQGP
ncbi:helix-turn-helix domain-containing protein [Streptomyces sp. NPDC087263]|uniref:helix-turn-helix domain-containing protein n=1 Tax=Streptomyces sp. NPDC087263 TaxID=3365773 RepID=UPI0037FE438C